MLVIFDEVVARRGGGSVVERPVSRAKMWRWAVLWQTTSLLLVGGTLDFRYFTSKQHLPSTQANCFDSSILVDRHGRAVREGWRPKPSKIQTLQPTSATYPTFPLLNTNEIMARRIDRLLPNAEDIVKEHAKLVQDINSLRQVVFVSPLVEENRDYDESILQEIIEISTTPRPLPKLTSSRAPPKPTKTSSIPIILLGGASQPDVVKTQPIRFTKPISLVGSSISPLMKHPYPFVMHGSSSRPYKYCMNPMHMMFTTTQKPSLLQRLLNSILPRGR
ncbi:uncharacterized protein LOC114355807 [Ostrinia furnacalis]|uniref:uncharacterized protein LOC114355807 n=1 Tax=Ostrinia furnacalis TaxID=93504 RepID=UPI00103E3927|nr:uncharacterized protein LOC114355807 [Ostrinia furnacalis]